MVSEKGVIAMNTPHVFVPRESQHCKVCPFLKADKVHIAPRVTKEVRERDRELLYDLMQMSGVSIATVDDEDRVGDFLAAALADQRAELIALIPTNWLDSLLSGPDAVLTGKGGTWGCPDIERLLWAVKERLTTAAIRSEGEK